MALKSALFHACLISRQKLPHPAHTEKFWRSAYLFITLFRIVSYIPSVSCLASLSKKSHTLGRSWSLSFSCRIVVLLSNTAASSSVHETLTFFFAGEDDVTATNDASSATPEFATQNSSESHDGSENSYASRSYRRRRREHSYDDDL